MDKKTFYHFLLKNFKGLSDPEQLDALIDIGTWTEELHDKLLKNGYVCYKCHKFSRDINSINTIHMLEKRLEPNGSELITALVESHNYECPHCKALYEFDYKVLKYYKKQENLL